MSKLYEDAATWESDVYGSLARSRKRALVFASVSWALTGLTLVGLVLLIPLKEAVPYVIQQDTETGYLRVLRAVETGPLTQNEALVQYHLVQYVQNREGYDRGSIKTAVDTAYLMSAGSARDEYVATLANGHPENPVVMYGDRATVHVQVKSVAFLNESTASVRFSTETRDPAQTRKDHWVAIIGYRFVQSPATQEVRFKNPLGFQVTTYRRSSEVVKND